MLEVNIKELSLHYANKVILDNISFNIDAKFTGIIGPNGAGKSTLLKCISQLLKFSHGIIEINQKDINSFSKEELAKIRAFVSADEYITTNLITVRQYISFGRSPYQSWLGTFSSKDYFIINRAIESTGIKELVDKNIDQLSSGERQRVQIARAITQEPQLLLLDEPTSHLDIKYQIDIMKLLKKIADSGVKVISIMHDLNLAANFCNKIIILNKGKLIGHDNPVAVLTAENLEKIFGNKWDISEKPFRIYPRIEIDV